jgi:hypothetical protein
MRAHIAELNAQIDMLKIDVQRQQIIAGVNYYLAGVSYLKEFDNE